MAARHKSTILLILIVNQWKLEVIELKNTVKKHFRKLQAGLVFHKKCLNYSYTNHFQKFFSLLSLKRILIVFDFLVI
jgi:hypothetical protein